MPSRPTLLFILAWPLGAAVYSVAATVIQDLVPTEPILSLLIPLFVAGLAMMPLIIPFFDRKATEDLAEYRRQQAAAGPTTTESHETSQVADPLGEEAAVGTDPDDAEGTSR